MRKFVQTQILNLIPTVWQGIQYVADSNTNEAAALKVLNDCKLGINTIDNSFKVGLSEDRYMFYREKTENILGMLEFLKEKLGNYGIILKIINDIKNQFEIVINELLNEKEVKLEIIFMPYKASMWDSLESIWRAASKDDSCEAYVIPIPYYSKDSNNNFSQYHYEGDLFPKDVPILNYNSYNLKVRKPDAIYIHNPYDHCNYVTSVDPRYYSYNLKEDTNMLVYVPYFVMGGDVSEKQIQLPIFDYLDKIVVQSEKYKKYYMENVAEDKILALGSPKIDRVIHFNKFKPEISEEWKNKIKNKKVVLYNISISGLLKHGSQAIKKLKYVFDYFKGKEGVVLLWRPHPLIESTLVSMRPTLLKEYLKVKEGFIREQIGIYDDTPDITASIAWSDAYIGEATSSVVHLFGAAGKPIFLLDEEIDRLPTEEDVSSTYFLDCFIENNEAWFVASGYNALCKMNLDTGSIERVVEIPSKNAGERYSQYCDVIKVEDKVIMLPFLSSTIYEYNVNTKKLKGIELEEKATVNFDRMIKYKNSIFMKPKGYPAIAEYDVESGRVKYHKECMKEFIDIGNNNEMFLWGVCRRENKLLMASGIVNKVLEFNMDTYEWKTHIVGSEGLNYFGMEFDGKDCWLIPNEGKTIVRWNYESGKFKEYTDYPRNFEGDNKGFVSILKYKDFMVAFPREGNMIVKIDINTGKMSEFKLKLPYREGERKSCYGVKDTNYLFEKKYDKENIVAFTTYDNSLMIINTQTRSVRRLPCRMGKAEVMKAINLQEHFCKWGENTPYACKESKFVTLKDFIKYAVTTNKWQGALKQIEAYSEEINNLDGTCGEKVHERIKEQLINEYRG